MNLLKLLATLVLAVVQVAPGKSVTGTVRLTTGAPATGVRVVAMPANDLSVLVSLTQTDKDGRYVLEDVPPGRYFIAAGPVSFLTFYPGTLEENTARVVSITQNGTSVSGIDFAVGTISTASVNRCCRLSGQIVMEDGSPVPNLQLQIANPGGGAGILWRSQVTDPGGIWGTTFSMSMQPNTTVQLVVNGLPPGYFLKSAPFGTQDMAHGPVPFDAKASTTMNLTIGYRPLSTLQPTIARGKILNVPAELDAASFNLTSTMPGGPTVVAPLQPGQSFVFPGIPVGAYRAGVVSPAGHASVSSILVVIRDAGPDLKIDFRDNPFPEMEGPYVTPSPFVDGSERTITGVATQPLTPILQGQKAAFFRLSVKDPNGVASPWAIYTVNSAFVPKIVPGETYAVTGPVARDGTNRLNANPF